MLAIACAFAAFVTLLSRPVKAPAGAPPVEAH
jgi:DHA2 family multidrug resistance protein